MEKSRSTLSTLKQAPTAKPLVKAAGCSYCWMYKVTAFTARCVPGPIYNIVL